MWVDLFAPTPTASTAFTVSTAFTASTAWVDLYALKVMVPNTHICWVHCVRVHLFAPTPTASTVFTVSTVFTAFTALPLCPLHDHCILCGPVYGCCSCRHADEQGAARSRPIRSETSASLHGGPLQVGWSNQPWRSLFKGNILNLAVNHSFSSLPTIPMLRLYF